ncbi:MAG TPA: GNAT family N-acetyltransferase [Erythrobacter sp.]|nr:GNAT family N-acetyltransferase [Erythrobacter sp.]
MYESRIAADLLTVAATSGFPPAIDALADCNLSGHGFLRATWYRAGAATGGRTLLLGRGDTGADGTVIAAIPTVPFGPVFARARKVPGAYWPFRSPLIAPDCNAFDLAHALEHPAARTLGPVWRVGPARVCDPTMQVLTQAAQIAGWSVLARPVGTSWVIDLDAARAAGYPRASVAKKMRAGWRKLEALGTPHWRHVRGDQWSESVLDDLARIEGDSWIARSTDGSGAKFINREARAFWHAVLADTALAERLSATILMLDDRPIAFSFDLDDGPVQYSIAGSYAEDLARLNIGKIVNFRAMDDAIADGQHVLDMGLGDSGYKREMGAAAGYDMADLLFVRSRTAARLLAPVWGAELTPARSLSMPARQRARG